MFTTFSTKQVINVYIGFEQHYLQKIIFILFLEVYTKYPATFLQMSM